MSESKDKASAHRRKASFLVRVWQEDRGVEGGEPVLRGYLRDLSSGKERYLRDPADLGAEILRHFRSPGDQEVSSGDSEAASAELSSKK